LIVDSNYTWEGFMTTTTSEWQNVDAGPRQLKELRKAVSALRMEGTARVELSGVVGGAERRSAVYSLMSPPRAEVVALDEAIHVGYHNQVTRANVREIIAAYGTAMQEAVKSRPVDDHRRSQDEDAELRAKIAARDAAVQAEQDARDAVLTQVLAKAPAGAKGLIYAEYRVDASDSQADYAASHTRRTVAIGWRYSSRENFRALAAAAAQFPETAHMASQGTLDVWRGTDDLQLRAPEPLERRDNYSMGMGNYLSDHGWGQSGTGWIVRSADLPCKWVGLTEDAIPARSATLAPTATSSGPVTVRPSSIGRDGVVEILFADKPPAEVRDELKAHGFRWAKSNSCWYGCDVAYAESLAATA
jgi:hypothetical protein